MIQPIYCCLITLSSGIHEEEFERFLTDEVFPTLEVLQRNVRGITHFLFKNQGESTQSQYMWMMELDLVGSGTATDGVDKVYETMKQKLQSYGTLSPPFVKVS